MNFTEYFRKNHYLPLLIFAVSMGLLEAIVVVYIRTLFYPDGFNFPLKELPQWLIVVEWSREICTLLMLGSVAFISGRNFLKRFSVFLFIFGVWDILYYIGLKIFLDWPESLLTWDILFLIPITWVGPVLAPVICSIMMIAIALIFDSLLMKNRINKLAATETILLLAGASCIYYTYIIDFGKILIEGNFLNDFSNLPVNPEFLKILTTWVPTNFNWTVFAFGVSLICVAIWMVIKRSKRIN